MPNTPNDPNQSRASDRRSSVRVRSLLPLSLRVIEEAEIPAMEARILDLAVMESDGVLHDAADWSEHGDEMSREAVFVLREIRALRQQMTEIQRLVDRQGEGALEPRWITINDRGFHCASADSDPPLVPEAFVECKIRIPSVHNPDILAIGEVVRVDDSEEPAGAVVEFRAISQMHKKAIIRYALRRERQLARSSKPPVFRDDD